MMDPQTARVSLVEYDKLDAASSDRLEYRDRYVCARVVPSGNHERIKRNRVAHVEPLLKSTSCELFLGGVKLICPNIDRTIPDLGVTCDERDRASLDSLGEATIEHPRSLVEIMSLSKQGEDRSGKLDSYREIAKLTHDVLIDSRKLWMLVHERGPHGRFVINGPLRCVSLPTLGERSLAIVDDRTTVPRML